MTRLVCCVFLIIVKNIECYHNYELSNYLNSTDPATRQIYEFAQKNSMPMGILTTSAGKFVEIRESISLNSDAYSNSYSIDLLSHLNAKRIPERVINAKGAAVYGYFEVTNDVSNYTKADVFNGVGRKTPVLVRFSTMLQSLGGSDLGREPKGLAAKFFTREGNLDLLCLNFPVFFTRDPLDFTHFINAIKRNPKTNLFDNTPLWDLITKKAETLHAIMWLFSEYGIPNGYRKMNAYPIHTYEIHNNNKDIYFVRFSFRSEQGVENLRTSVAQSISGRDPDYYNRDLYDAIENKIYPAWKLEMDVMTFNDIKKVDYNPFEVTRLWKNGTYKTICVGRLVLDKNADNHFKVSEQSAFNPDNLVPGILGPIDSLFKARRSTYRDAQVHRLGVNHNRIDVNEPIYWNTYNRDGVAPLKCNMKESPNYYPNSFSGPVPYVDPGRPKERFTVYDVNAVDLEPAAYFYNNHLTSDQQSRLKNNIIQSLVTVSPSLQRRAVRLLTLTDPILGRKVAEDLLDAKKVVPIKPLRVLMDRRRTTEEKCNNVTTA